MRRNRKSSKQLAMREIEAKYLPSFASTPEEIRRAVEKNAIARGTLLIKVIVSLHIDDLFNEIESLSKSYDKEDFYQEADSLEIDVEALTVLDSIDPPIPYPYYFCKPKWLTGYPQLIFYYRNVAMLSSKVMSGIGLNTKLFEDGRLSPTTEEATEISTYFNKITSSLIKVGGVTRNRHIEMLFGNLGDSLGGVSRNEVGRAASASVMRYVIQHMHSLGKVNRITYSLKGSFDESDEDLNNVSTNLEVTAHTEIFSTLQDLENKRVKYLEVLFDNGVSLLLDRQINWKNQTNIYQQLVNDEQNKDSVEQTTNAPEDSSKAKSKFGIDLHSTNDNSNSLIWGAELKGGADPAGSDEHWKTATQALNRVIEACQETGREKPSLSFIATILVERVAIEAQNWITSGKLSSVYNLYRIEQNEEYRKLFLSDIEGYLGYSKTQ